MATKPRKPKQETQPQNLWLTAGLAVELTATEKQFRAKFVDEYLVDYCPYSACLRLGFAQDFARDWAGKFMSEPYVAQLIAQREEGEPTTEDARSKEQRRIYANLWRLANYNGPGSSHAAQVAATAKLASLYGMDAPTKSETTVKVETPVQFYIPHNGRDEKETSDAPQRTD